MIVLLFFHGNLTSFPEIPNMMSGCEDAEGD